MTNEDAIDRRAFVGRIAAMLVMVPMDLTGLPTRPPGAEAVHLEFVADDGTVAQDGSAIRVRTTPQAIEWLGLPAETPLQAGCRYRAEVWLGEDGTAVGGFVQPL